MSLDSNNRTLVRWSILPYDFVHVDFLFFDVTVLSWQPAFMEIIATDPLLSIAL